MSISRKTKLTACTTISGLALCLLAVLALHHFGSNAPQKSDPDVLWVVGVSNHLDTDQRHPLGDPSSDELIDRFIDCMVQDDPIYRDYPSWNGAMEALARIGRPAVPKLIATFQDAPRKSAAARLRDGQRPPAVWVQARTREVQAQSAMVLGRIGDPRALPALEGLPRDYSRESAYIMQAIHDIEKSIGRLHPPQTSTPSPDTEMYDVYSEAIRELFLGEDHGGGRSGAVEPGLKHLLAVITDHTVCYKTCVAGELGPASKLRNRGIPIDDETPADLELKCRDAITLKPKFNLPADQLLISDDELSKVFSKRPGSWDGFYKRYPRSVGIVSVSRVGFNRERNQAFLYISRGCGSLCGVGYEVFLVKENGAWSVKQQDVLWVS